MPHRRTWSKGLRVVFWLSVLGLVVGVGQTAYWAFVTHEFFPELTAQGLHAAIAFVPGVLCVVAGAFSLRKTFVILSLVTAALYVCVPVYINFGIFAERLQDILGGQWRLFWTLDTNAGIYYWNWICIGVNGAILYYLIRNEIKFWSPPGALNDEDLSSRRLAETISRSRSYERNCGARVANRPRGS